MRQVDEYNCITAHELAELLVQLPAGTLVSRAYWDGNWSEEQLLGGDEIRYDATMGRVYLFD